MLASLSRKAIISPTRSLGCAKNDCAKETNYSLLGTCKELERKEGRKALTRQQIVAVNLPLRKYERFQQVCAGFFV
jgi:hypothetical protein